MSDIAWQLQPFEALSTTALHAMLRLRSDVFVVEQQCIFPDIDGLDPACLHLSAWRGDRLLAYARLMPPGLKAPGPVIGRVVTAPEARSTGLGHQLNRQAVQACLLHWPEHGITLFAQAHLQSFYARAGFVGVGEPFDEDGILHREMHRPHGEPL